MLPSILQAAAADQSAGDDATLALLGLLSFGRSVATFLQRAAPPLETGEPAAAGEGGLPDPPLALALGILALHRHLTQRIDGVLREGEVAAAASAGPPPELAPRPALRGLLR